MVEWGREGGGKRGRRWPCEGAMLTRCAGTHSMLCLTMPACRTLVHRCRGRQRATGAAPATARPPRWRRCRGPPRRPPPPPPPPPRFRRGRRRAGSSSSRRRRATTGVRTLRRWRRRTTGCRCGGAVAFGVGNVGSWGWGGGKGMDRRHAFCGGKRTRVERFLREVSSWTWQHRQRPLPFPQLRRPQLVHSAGAQPSPLRVPAAAMRACTHALAAPRCAQSVKNGLTSLLGGLGLSRVTWLRAGALSPSQLQHATFLVTGMTCASCVAAIEGALRK